MAKLTEAKIVEQLLTVFGMKDMPDFIDSKDVLVYIAENIPEDYKVTDKEAFINALSDFRRYSINWGSATINEETFKEAALDKAENDIDFINEIIQNADDCKYDVETPAFSVSFGVNEIVIHYNELGMTWSDIAALTSYGYSNKNAASDNDTTFDKTTIGEKGIGFKFIFRVCDRVEIYSNGFNFILYQREYQGVKDLGFIPEWNETSEEYNGTMIILRDIKADALKLFNDLKEKYSKNLCTNPVMFTKKLRQIKAVYGNDTIICTRSDDFGMESENEPIAANEPKTAEITMKCSEKEYFYDLHGISCPVQISKEAVEQRYQSRNKEIAYDDVYRRIFIFAAFDKDGSLQTDMEKIGGTMYSYLPTAEQLTVPLIVQLPMRPDKERMHISSEFFLWNSVIFGSLNYILGQFYEKITYLFHDKPDILKQVWKLLPQTKAKPDRLFDRDDITIHRNIKSVNFKYDAFAKAPCFYSLLGKMISGNEARMLDEVLHDYDLELEYAENSKDIIIAYDKNKEGIIKHFDLPSDSVKNDILDRIAEKHQKDLFEIWKKGVDSNYLPKLDSWKNRSIFPAAVDNNGTAVYKPLTDGIWFADNELTSPEGCFLHFYRCGNGDEKDKMKESVTCVPENSDGKKAAVLKAIYEISPKFSPTYEQLVQLAQWGFDDVNDPLDVWKEAQKAEDSDISGTESAEDTPAQRYFAKIAAWCPERDIKTLILLAKAYCHEGFKDNGYKDAGSDKTQNPEVELPPFSKWTPELRKALNKLPFAVSRNKSFVINKDDSSNSFVNEELKINIIRTYGLSEKTAFYYYSSEEKDPKFACFLNTVVFFDEVNNVSDGAVTDFIGHILDSNHLLPSILNAKDPLKKNDRKLLDAITKISENRCKLLTQDSEKSEDVPNDPISELLQNVDDSKLRSGDGCTNKFEVEQVGDAIVLRYTEKGFSVWDFYCITHRHSTGNINQGDSIGHFGTGFRSVYTMFKKVEIRSRGCCCELEPYDENSPSSKDRYEEYTAKGSDKQQEWRKNYLRLQPIPYFKDDTNPINGETTFTLYLKDKDKIGEVFDEFQNPKRYVFLDRLGSYDEDSRIFTSDAGEKYLTYTKTLSPDINFPSYQKGLKREPTLTMTVRFGKKPEFSTPYYCGLPLKGRNSHLYCYVNVPAFIPDDSRKTISDNDSNKDWNNNVLEKARLAIGEILAEYAEYYYLENHRDFLPPYEYLTGDFFDSNSMADLRIFPAEDNAGNIVLCSVKDIISTQVYIPPEKIIDDAEAIKKIKDYQLTSDNMLPIIYDEGVCKFLYNLYKIIYIQQGNIPASALFSAFYPGKRLYDNLPDLPENDKWISVNRISEWCKKYNISADNIKPCVSGLYGDKDLCKMMFEYFFKINNETARSTLYDAAEKGPDEQFKNTVLENNWIPVRINNKVVLLDTDKYYVKVSNAINSDYAVQCYDWESELFSNILTCADDFINLFKSTNDKEIPEGCTDVFLRRTDDPIEVEWNSEYAPVLRTYCKDYYSKAAQHKGQDILTSKDNGINAPAYGLRFTFSSNTLKLDSLAWLKRKFEVCVDSGIVSWEALNEKCLIIQNSSYDGYAWQMVNGEDKIVLFCKKADTLPDVLRKLISDLFDRNVILGEKLLEDDDYMISRHNGDFSEVPDNIEDLMPYYADSLNNAPPTIDNDFYLIGTWDFQREDGKWQRYQGYGITADEADKGELPVCPVCGGKLLAHRKSCKIEYVSVMPKGNADNENTFHIPVLMCSTCSSSMRYYYSITLEADDGVDVIDAITKKPDKLRICFNSSKGEHRLLFRPTVYHRLLMLDFIGQINHNAKQDNNPELTAIGM